MSPFRLSIAGLAVTAALGIAACGSDNSSDSKSNDSSSSGSAPASTDKVKVVETEFKIAPASPSIDKAGKVTFAVTNSGKIPHALEVEGPNGEAKTGTIDPGKAEDLEVDLGKAGTYEWYCPIGNHRAQGMKGEIKVAGGGSGAKEDSGGSSNGY
ncbi:MAG: hypothetical protein QOH58_424 [Thermoleophilaceae bacterium]|nr:hypothetical protein [Thermoleophilaceae bacterium]